MSPFELIVRIFFHKRIDRELAINGYLSKFNKIELRHLHNVYITAIETGKKRKDSHPYGVHGNDPYPYIDIATYLFSKAKYLDLFERDIQESESDIRKLYRLELTKAFLRIKPQNLKSISPLSNLRLDVDLDIDEESDILSNAFTNLNRIYVYGTRADIIN